MAGTPHFEVFPFRVTIPGPEFGAPTGQYGWRFRAANGQITAVGGEGFTRREDAHRAVRDFVVAVRVGYGERPEAHVIEDVEE